MPRLLWLAEAAREAGLEVAETVGWKERGSTSFNPNGIVCHHTGGGSTGEMSSLRVLINGRSDVPGPLANYGLGRSGKVYVVAAGRANHAGAGSWQGMVGNSSVIGIEAENDGEQLWPVVQVDAYKKLCAAITKRLSGDAKFVCGHKEWTRRKPDPHTISMDKFREDVTNLLKPAPTPEERMARIPNAVGFAVLSNNDLVITTNDGAIYHFDADGTPDEKEYAGAYNQHKNLWGPEGSQPTTHRSCIGVYAQGNGYVQVFDDGARYHWGV